MEKLAFCAKRTEEAKPDGNGIRKNRLFKRIAAAAATAMLSFQLGAACTKTIKVSVRDGGVGGLDGAISENLKDADREEIPATNGMDADKESGMPEFDAVAHDGTADSAPPLDIQSRDAGSANDASLAPEAPVRDAPEESAPSRGYLGGKWKYCREINIAGDFPADYQHAIKLNRARFDYSHAKPDLSDLRFVEGACSQATDGKILPAWVQAINGAGESRIWVKTSTPNLPKLSLYYGNAQAGSEFSGKNVFIAFGKGADFDSFTVVNQRGTLAKTPRGLEFSNFPWGNGGMGESYAYIDAGMLPQGFAYEFTIKYSATACRPYLVVGVSSSLSGDFDMGTNAIGYVRTICTASTGRDAALRIRKDGMILEQAVGQFSPSENAEYYARMTKQGSSVSLNFYMSESDRNLANSALVSITSNNAPLSPMRYVYAATGLDATDQSRSVTGILSEAIIRAYVTPEPAYFIGEEQAK